MTTEEMVSLYKALIEYRKGEDPRIERTYYLKDLCLGTEVTYYIEEYTVVCKFFCIGKNEWELGITALLHNDVRFQICDWTTFQSADTIEIPNRIDQMIAALRKMPTVIGTIRNKFAQCMEEEN